MEWKALGELGKFYSGLSGKTKSDFTGGNEKLITYVNVFNNPSLKTDVPERVKIAEGEKQNTIQYGDILFTGSSETPDECGMSSVLTHAIEEKLYLNSFCFGFRFFDLSDKCPSFMKYLFRSTNIRKAICKTANGVTRYNISKKEFAKIEIPIIPLPVQEEIVRILDTFTELQAELQAELQKRKQQYNYYLDNLLNFKNINRGGQIEVRWMKMSDVCNIRGRIGFRGYTRNDQVKRGEGALSLSPSNISNGKMDYSKGTYITWTKYDESPEIQTFNGDIIFCKTASIGKVAFVTNLPCKATINPQLVVLKDIKCNARFLSYFLETNYIQNIVMSLAGIGSVPNISQKALSDILIPIPPLEEQNRIVSILDRFDTLTNDLTAGLPAEIEKRKQQYEYYRDKLLTFKRKEA